MDLSCNILRNKIEKIENDVDFLVYTITVFNL